MLTNSIESAQKKVEERNFGIRRDVLQYDDVMNRQREVIYGQRDKVLDGESVRDSIVEMIKGSIESTVKRYTADAEIHENWNLDGPAGLLSAAGSPPTDDFQYSDQELEDIVRQGSDRPP